MTEELYQEIQEKFESSPFWDFIGLQVREIKNGYVSLALPIKNDFINARNSVHGGIYASLLDTNMGMTARTTGINNTATLQLNIQYLKSISEGTLYSEASIIHESRNSVYIEGKLTNEAGDLLAHCTGTFKLFKGESAK